MDRNIADTLKRFDTIGLEKLNRKAAMLTRLDNKYIVLADAFQPALQAFGEQFDVLEIRNKRVFTYATRYFDDPDLRSYYDHHQGRRKRSKIRVRTYVDAGFSYLEIKLKDKRKVTVKKRLKIDSNGDGLCAISRSPFIDQNHRELYQTGFGRPLTPVIEMQYQRITLVAKHGGERMTIDTGLQFSANGVLRHTDPGLFIVETKSARGYGIADRILRANRLHPTKSCSKYCVGMVATGQVSRRNRFLPSLRRLRLDQPPVPAANQTITQIAA